MIFLVSFQEILMMSKYAQELKSTAKEMMDESNGTCNKRSEKQSIAATVENRRAY